MPVIQNNNELPLYYSLELYWTARELVFPIPTFWFWYVVDFIFQYLKQFPSVAVLARGIVLYGVGMFYLAIASIARTVRHQTAGS
jgi:hypothetical protein